MDELNDRSDVPADSPSVERYVLFGDFTVDLLDTVLKKSSCLLMPFNS
jgi:hypothetical protein